MKYGILGILVLCIWSCGKNSEIAIATNSNSNGLPIYLDTPYVQEYAVKYNLSENQKAYALKDVISNRNGNIQILSNKGLLVPENGQMFYSGTLTPDISYGPMTPKNIAAFTKYREHIVYLDDSYVFSNAWAGKLQIAHGLENAKLLAGGDDFHFLVYNGKRLSYLNQDGVELELAAHQGISQIIYQEAEKRFLLISPEKITAFIPGKPLKDIYVGSEINCATLIDNGNKIVIGTSKGYFFLGEDKLVDKLPWPNITTMEEINGSLWFGTTWGAFKLLEDGNYGYYSGERWLPGNEVIRITKGPEDTILILTDKGVGSIESSLMTLQDKAMFYEKQVREKNIRYGFNCSLSRLPNGYASAVMKDQPSDNLWTAMYLVSQLYRYKVTGSEEAKQNAFESFEALERLHQITTIKGLFARSFERDYKVTDEKKEGWQKKELLSGSPAKLWLPGNDHSNWTWRSTASSDQTVGQIFALTAILELVEDQDWRDRALECLDNLMGYIVDNDFYIIDVDGEPTLWGKWNPSYVNGFPSNVGDRRLYSSNIIAFLQTAYKFTGKEKYKTSAYQLMEEHGYLNNLMHPISQIGPSDDDELSKNLSHEWNHSDDEMYFLAYFGLYPYAFTPELQKDYKKSIQDHWQVERPEKNALWNFIYAATGAEEFDLDNSIWFLKTYPMDLRNWKMQNSHRKDITLLSDNFRLQTTKELLPMTETPLYRHNGNIFDLDRDGDGKQLISAGDTWLLPYWMGRYLGVISAPQKQD
ncbi:hypothetical protein DHD32_16000 [Arenibacter sp. TNZ]|uniref:hypothetical protein n=1 Tax=Arenibacter TaxID=178469 RepID=UPI000CD3DFF6|nr:MULTISPECIES: hypothetical protein [Arenibacter]MCM4172992.1 hypothetical protein [Arenibacter sp. TNZ]